MPPLGCCSGNLPACLLVPAANPTPQLFLVSFFWLPGHVQTKVIKTYFVFINQMTSWFLEAAMDLCLSREQFSLFNLALVVVEGRGEEWPRCCQGWKHDLGHWAGLVRGPCGVHGCVKVAVYVGTGCAGWWSAGISDTNNSWFVW